MSNADLAERRLRTFADSLEREHPGAPNSLSGVGRWRLFTRACGAAAVRAGRGTWCAFFGRCRNAPLPPSVCHAGQERLPVPPPDPLSPARDPRITRAMGLSDAFGLPGPTPCEE